MPLTHHVFDVQVGGVGDVNGLAPRPGPKVLWEGSMRLAGAHVLVVLEPLAASVPLVCQSRPASSLGTGAGNASRYYTGRVRIPRC